MIAEFALTPAIFDESVHPDVADWRVQLTALKRGMFPQPNLSPVLVTDISGLWEGYAKMAADAVRHPSAKLLVQALLTSISNRLVRRSAPPGQANLRDERWWARVGCSASKVEPIERMLASCACRSASLDLHGLRGLDDVETDVFWENISVEWSPPAAVRDQVATLRKLCVHGEFVWLTSPYIGGMDTDETPFARELIREVFCRPDGWPPPREVTIHTKRDDRVSIGTQIQSIESAIRPHLHAGQAVQLVVREKFEERIVLAGSMTLTSSGLQPKARWGVHMGHVARRRDARGGVHEWKQLNDDSVGHWFRFFGNPGHARALRRVEIRV